jgi:hypothetical protein
VKQLSALRRAVAADYRAALTQVARDHHLDGLTAEVRHALLGGRLVYEYFAEDRYWYDVCPLCA